MMNLLIANWTVLLATLVAFAVAMLLMAVGVLFSKRCLRGSCGGPDVLGPNGESLACATCPLRRKRNGSPVLQISGDQLPATQGGIP